jgi:hypothetical protein
MTKQDRIDAKAARKASELRQKTARKEAYLALVNNQCPKCGLEVRTNLALTGWVQCSQFGAEGFRAVPSMPSCDWQGFTE